MNVQRGTLVSGGRLQIPAAFRRELGISDGDVVMMRVQDGELRLWTRDAAIRRAQEMYRKHAKPGVSLVDELIAERRAEAERE